MTREQALQHIEHELSTAKHALEIGNGGMARVCARRAAGAAISFWLQTHKHNAWGLDAMNRLRKLAADVAMPREVIESAQRLIAKAKEDMTAPSTTDPINDATIIINFLMETI